MAGSEKLDDRIDAAFAASVNRLDEMKARELAEFEDHKRRLEQFDDVVRELRDKWRPRLETLARKFGDRVNVEPHVEPSLRSVTFDFKSDLADIDLRFAASPDADARNVVFTYDLRIIPILMKFNSHAEISFPLEAVDEDAVASWMDDCIMSFVDTYLALQENQYYLRDHMVEDPIAKVKFPKHAAAATCEFNGLTYYFVGDATLREFQNSHREHFPKTDPK
jgi:YHS domain-containing protein